jgi:hypothetical protein
MEMFNALTSRTANVMSFVLAGIAFDDSNPFPDNVQVRKSAVNQCHRHNHHVWCQAMCGLLAAFLAISSMILLNFLPLTFLTFLTFHCFCSSYMFPIMFSAFVHMTASVV